MNDYARPPRVLVVEDDAEIAQALQRSLRMEGYEVRIAGDGESALAEADGFNPDLVVLDLGLPTVDGMDVARHLRERGDVPILILTARDAVDARVEGLDAGADDYLVKPFAIGELLARIRVALRHRGSTQQPALRHVERDGLSIDLDARRVERDGDTVHLTPTEFELLARLVRSAGRIVTHRQLLADVWGVEHLDDTHYLRLYMGQLRAKLERQSSQPRFLLTEIGVGYRFAID
ncbi:MAG: response regulator [Solirubrobacteraceae bacterium]